MNKNIKIAPSLLAADVTQLGNEVKEIEKTGAEYLHLDGWAFCAEFKFFAADCKSAAADMRYVF